MKNKVHFKSLLIGLVAGVLVSFTLGAALKEPAGPVGRFQIAGTHSHAFVLDTKTGQVWKGYFHAGSGNTDNDFVKPKLGTE